jgi:hypothetical protein
MIKQRNFKMNQGIVNQGSDAGNLGADLSPQHEKSTRDELKKEFKFKELPQNLTSSDLEQLQILKFKLKNISNDAKENDFVKSLDEIIDFLEDDVMDNKKEIVLYVMHKLERFILKPKSGAVKKQLAVKILSKLFYNDENLTGLIIDSMMTNHKQIKMLGRLGLKLYRFFFNNK